jgi:hypothetical protein
MDNLKITIDQLKNYFGTGLKFEDYYFGKLFEGEMDYHNFPNFIDNSITSKLKLYRLSDLDKFIPELGFVPIDELEDLYKINSMWYGWSEFMKTANLKMIDFPMAQQLFQWHFWPFGDEYFEKGLVIDKMKQQ